MKKRTFSEARPWQALLRTRKFWQSLQILMAVFTLAGCGENAKLPASAGIGTHPTLPPPETSVIPTVHIAEAKGWPKDVTPIAAKGMTVTEFAGNLDHPRWIYVLPNGDVLVAETNAPAQPKDNQGLRGWVMGKVMKKAGAAVPSADRITLLRDTNNDGVAEYSSVLLDQLHSPFGMSLVGDFLYVANTDAVLRFPYAEGDTVINDPGEVLLKLPAGPINHHWTKNIIASLDKQKLYVTVGSNSNIGENGMEAEEGRAAIWQVDLSNGQHHIFASGLRNPNGMAWEPVNETLWTVVNERDELGGDLVPDYLTSVKQDGFYGWPYSYYGNHLDERVKPQNPQLVENAIVPDYAVGSHTAPLGLAFSNNNQLAPSFAEGMFIGQHGSWNRKPFNGYKVIFVPFQNGQPVGEPFDVLTGFIDEDNNAYGRPVGVAIDGHGALLVADDVGNKIWRVSAEHSQAELSLQSAQRWHF